MSTERIEIIGGPQFLKKLGSGHDIEDYECKVADGNPHSPWRDVERAGVTLVDAHRGHYVFRRKQ